MTNLAHRAEQAVLGAVLREPHRFTQMPRLDPDDFLDDQHRNIFRGIERALNREIPWQAAFDGVDDRHRAALQDACPEPAHVPAYGRMVLEARLQRQLLAHAVRLQYNAAHLHGDIKRFTEGAAPANTAVERLSTPVLRADGTVEHPGIQRLLGHEMLLSVALRAHAAAFDPSRESAPEVTAVSDRAKREELVIASIIQRHAETRAAPGRMHPEAFTGPRQELFDAIVDLYLRREPVDQLTVDWERARHQVMANGAAGADTSYGARLARMPVNAARALETADMLIAVHAQALGASQSPAVPGRPVPAPQAPGSTTLLQPPPGPAGEPRLEPRI